MGRHGAGRSEAMTTEPSRPKVEDKMFAQFEAYFPDLAKLVVFRNLSTPLTTQAITRHHKGAFYGLDTTPDR
jgi:all-trans-retinol 13,14-reductase